MRRRTVFPSATVTAPSPISVRSAAAACANSGELRGADAPAPPRLPTRPPARVSVLNDVMTDLGTLGGTNSEGFDVNARARRRRHRRHQRRRRARVSMAKRRDDRLEHDDPGRLRMDSEIGARHFRRRRRSSAPARGNGVTRAFLLTPPDRSRTVALRVAQPGGRQPAARRVRSERRSAS